MACKSVNLTSTCVLDQPPFLTDVIVQGITHLFENADFKKSAIKRLSEGLLRH